MAGDLPLPGPSQRAMRDQAMRLVRFGALAIATGFWDSVICSLNLLYFLPWPHEHAWWENSVSVGMFALGMVLLNKGQQTVHLARRYMHAATPASIPPLGAVFVLYLRAFNEDAVRTEAPRLTPMMWTDFFNPVSPLYALLVLNGSPEEHLIACVRDVGPVIAVGNSGEQLPPAGARRLQLPSNDWQRPVRDLMSRARLVVLALDPTPGTLWEFVEATRTVPPERLLLVTPASKREYELFRQKATTLRERADEVYRRTGEPWTPPELPRNPSIGSKRVATQAPEMKMGFGGLISYTADRTPEVTPIKPFLVSNGAAGIGSALRRAVRPALNRLLAFEDAILEQGHPELLKKREYYRIRRMMATAFLVVGLALLPYRLKQLAWDTSWDLARMPEGWWKGVLYATASIAVGLSSRYMYRRLEMRLVPPADSP
jgi:hypothetical protein